MQNISDDSFTRLIAVMECYLPLGYKFKNAFKAVLFETAYQKGARILNFGQVQQTIWFMLSGLAREIRVDSQTFREKTSWFWPAGSFLFTTPGFFSYEPSEKTIELLERSELIWISLENWNHLKEHFGEARLVTEKIRSAYEKSRQHHTDELENWTTQERYLAHRGTLEDLLIRTKLRYVAEFMGMAPDTLGKLRKKYLRRR